MENRQPSKRSHSLAVSNNSAPMNNKKLCIQHTARESTVPSNSTPVIDAENLSKMIATFMQQNHGTLPPEIQNQLIANPTWNQTMVGENWTEDLTILQKIYFLRFSA
uniref:Uncharacterized protein n=1 Tax=Panagrolaimus sp. PS1159 TaxID=55785 RepID=A0AC35FHM5_9BILA